MIPFPREEETPPVTKIYLGSVVIVALLNAGKFTIKNRLSTSITIAILKKGVAFFYFTDNKTITTNLSFLKTGNFIHKNF